MNGLWNSIKLNKVKFGYYGDFYNVINVTKNQIWCEIYKGKYNYVVITNPKRILICPVFFKTETKVNRNYDLFGT